MLRLPPDVPWRGVRQAQLVYRHGDFWSHLSVAEPAPQKQEGSGRAAGADPGEVHALALSTGATWVALHEAGRLARIVPEAGTVVEYPLPHPGSEAQWLAVGPDGDVWYIGYAAGTVGRLRTAAAPVVTVRLGDAAPAGGGTVAGTLTLPAGSVQAPTPVLLGVDAGGLRAGATLELAPPPPARAGWAVAGAAALAVVAGGAACAWRRGARRR